MSSKMLMKLSDNGDYLYNSSHPDKTLLVIRNILNKKRDARTAALDSSIECPICKEKISYIWSEYCGVEKAICPTPGCIYYKTARSPCFPPNYTEQEKKLIAERPAVKRVKREIIFHEGNTEGPKGCIDLTKTVIRKPRRFF